MYREPFVVRCLGVLALLSVSGASVRAAPDVLPVEAKAPAPASDEDSLTMSAWRHFNAGRLLVDDGKLAEGLRELLQAHATPSVEPGETEFYLGMAYDGLRRLDSAILAYRRYVNRSPDTLNGRNAKERLAVLEKRRDPSAGPLLDESARGVGAKSLTPAAPLAPMSEATTQKTVAAPAQKPAAAPPKGSAAKDSAAKRPPVSQKAARVYN